MTEKLKSPAMLDRWILKAAKFYVRHNARNNYCPCQGCKDIRRAMWALVAATKEALAAEVATVELWGDDVNQV